MKVNTSEIKMGKKHYGFYVTVGDREIFFETAYQKKCKPLLEEICRELQIPDTTTVFEELKFYMRPAIAELKAISSGRKYFDFCGENFVYGDFIDKGKTDFYRLKK